MVALIRIIIVSRKDIFAEAGIQKSGQQKILNYTEHHLHNRKNDNLNEKKEKLEREWWRKPSSQKKKKRFFLLFYQFFFTNKRQDIFTTTSLVNLEFSSKLEKKAQVAIA